MLAEQYFPNLSRYPKTDGTPVDVVEAFKRERGYIDLDDPDQKRKYTPSSAIPFNPKLEGDYKAGIKRAKAEHEAAMQNIKSSKASLRRDDDRKRRKAAGRPKLRTEMPTFKGQKILNTLRAEGIYDVSEWPLSRDYLGSIITTIRKLGYNIEAIKEGRDLTHYKLIEQA